MHYKDSAAAAEEKAVEETGWGDLMQFPHLAAFLPQKLCT